MTNNDKSERRSVIIIQSLVHRREGFALVGRGEEEDGCGSYSGVTAVQIWKQSRFHLTPFYD